MPVAPGSTGVPYLIAAGTDVTASTVGNEAVPAVTHSLDPESGGPAGGLTAGLIIIPPPPAAESLWREREYVYGPDYVDEFVCQFDRQGDPIFMLQDANYNVVALLSWFGGPLAQYTYAPYGELVAAERFADHADNRVGHQGLFVERLDALSPTPLSGSGEPFDPYNYIRPSLDANESELYHNRNRTYQPALGRFLQRDPNATAMVVLDAAVTQAQSFLVLLGAFSAEQLYSDGANLFQYASSNPIRHRDPSGLDVWDDFDDAITDVIGHRMYVLGVLNESARVASISLNLALDIASGFLPGMGLYDAFQSVDVIANGRGGFWDAVNIATAAFPIAKAASNLMGLKSLFKVGRYGRMACNCFVAGTLVATPHGLRAIESLDVGDEVITRPEGDPCETNRVGRIARVFRDVAPATVWLTLSNGHVLRATPAHEVWTLEDGWTTAGGLQPGDSFIGLDGEPVTVIASDFDPTPVAVYNLEVEDGHTYFAEGVWVHNNSCTAGVQLWFEAHHKFAKFLGGAGETGGLMWLDVLTHREYTAGLFSELAQRGYHRGSNESWETYFKRVEGAYEKAIEITIDYTGHFDKTHGTGLLQAMLDEMAEQAAK